MATFDDDNHKKEFPGNDGNRSGELSNASSESKPKCKRNVTKTVRILRLFYESGRKFNFQTIREHGDSCLHSTISTFRHMYGIEFDDESHVVRGFGGSATRCKQYWLSRTPENLRRVRAFLGIADEDSAA